MTETTNPGGRKHAETPTREVPNGNGAGTVDTAARRIPARRRLSTWAGITNERITTDNPFGVKIPKDIAAYPPLIAVGSGLVRDFSTLYTAELRRVAREDSSANLGPQAAFNQELRRFFGITSGITNMVNARPLNVPLRIFSDLDESAGSVIGTGEPIRLPGHPDLAYEDMNPTQQAQHRDLCARSIYTDFRFSPGYVHAINWAHDTYDTEPGIYFGVISTKPQGGMSQYLMPTLDEVIPHAFRPELILSSSPKDVGAVDFYIPEIAAIAKDRWNPPTLRQAFTAFTEASPAQEQEALRQMLAAYPKDALDKPISDFDIKLFIIVRLQQIEKAQIEKMYRQDIAGTEVDLPPPETKDALIDDARLPARLFPGVTIIPVDRWRQIDDRKNKPIPKKDSGSNDDSGSEDDSGGENPLDQFPDL